MSSEDQLAIRVRLSGARSAIADANATKKAVAGVGKSAEKSGRQAREASSHFRLMGGAVGAFKYAAGAAGFASLAFGLKDVVTAGMKLQDQQTQLRQALKASGVQGSAAFDRINQAAEKLSAHGGFTTPEQLQGMTQFVRMTGSATKAVQLNAAATSLARGAHLGFTQTQRMMGQVMTGNVGRLQRYLGIIQPVKTAVTALAMAHKVDVYQLDVQAKAMGKAGPLWLKQQELLHGVSQAALQHAQRLDKLATAQNVVNLITAKYGGATAAFSHTAAGAMSNVKNAVEGLAARVGVLLLPLITKLARGLSSVVAVVQQHWPQISATVKTVFGVVKAVVGGSLGAVISVIKVSVDWFEKHKAVAAVLAGAIGGLAVAFGVLKVAELAEAGALTIAYGAQWAFNAAMEANPIMLVVTAIGALAAGLIYAYHHCKTFRQIVQEVFAWLKSNVPPIIDAVVGAMKDMVRWLVTNVPAGVRFAIRAFKMAFGPIIQVFTGIVQQLKGVWEIIKGVFTLNAGLVWKGVEDIFNGGVRAIGGIIKLIIKPFKAAFDLVKGIVKPVIDWLVGKIKWVIDKVLWLPREIAKLNPFSGSPNYTPAQRARPGGPSGALRRASGGPVPGAGVGDKVPALLTPGEFVVQRQIVNQVGMPAMQHFNQTGQMSGGQNITIEPAPVTLRLDSRTLAEGVLRYSLKRAARGKQTLASGSLVTS